ncbi:MAG: hypothetical protein WCF16_03360 [Alphaproteobacteria bacterium]
MSEDAKGAKERRPLRALKLFPWRKGDRGRVSEKDGLAKPHGTQFRPHMAGAGGAAYGQLGSERVECQPVLGKVFAVEADVRDAGPFQLQGNQVCREIVQAGKNENMGVHSPF